MKLILIGLLFTSPSFCRAGTVSALERTPPELSEYGITYERLTVKFDDSVDAVFWIEFDPGDRSKIEKMETPHDDSRPMREYRVAYIQERNDQAMLTVMTDSQWPLNRRSCSVGPGDESGSRTVACTLNGLDLPMDKNVEIFEATIKPSWRTPDIPIRKFRIMARFTKP